MKMTTYRTCLATIAFYLSTTVVQFSGELLVLRHPTTDTNSPRYLSCISEYDDAALIWNQNLSENGQNRSPDFKPKRPSAMNVSECAIWNSTGCRAQWEKISEWNVVESRNKPMAPVSDFRWEDFRERYSNDHIKFVEYQRVDEFSAASGSVTFSAIGIRDVHIFLSRDAEPTRGPCLWSILGGWEGTKSVIRSCFNAPQVGIDLWVHNCTEINKTEHESGYVLDKNEWRTFRLTWNSVNKTIQIFKYANGASELLLNGSVHMWNSTSHISIRLIAGSRVRFHLYNYFLTENTNAVISTTEISHLGEYICIDLLVGLCSECELGIYLVGKHGPNVTIGNILGPKNHSHDGLLSWQSVRLNKTLQYFTSPFFKLEIRPILKGAGKGRWAIDNFHMCKSDAERRESTLTIFRKSTSTEEEPRESCQKLSYEKSALFDLTSLEKIEGNENQSKLFYQELIKSCGSSCRNRDGGWSLCNSTGCICNRGYRGSDCSQACADGSYGYFCTETCGNCSTGFCNKATGFCDNGCAEYRLKPICKTKLPKLIIRNISDTTVTVRQMLDYDEKFEIKLYFECREKSAENSKPYQVDLKDSGIPSIYQTEIHNLKRDTVYILHTTVSMLVEEQTVTTNGPEIELVTTCYGNPNFMVEPGKHNLTVNFIPKENCTNERHSHYSVVRRLQGASNESQADSGVWFPFKWENLTSYSRHEVVISDSITGVIWYNETVCTYESEPSAVRNLNVTLKTDTNVTLRWDAPEHENGVIRNYSISYKVEVLRGCTDLNKSTPAQKEFWEIVKDKEISIGGLKPYAKYKAIVIAYTAGGSGIPQSISFETLESDIPTSRVSNLHFMKGNQRIAWDRTANCTTITGRTNVTRLIVRRSNNSIMNSIQTGYFHYDIYKLKLAPYELYTIRVYVIRNFGLPENPDIYEKLTWRTPAIAPSAVTKFEIYYADSETNTIKARWLPPNPANGELELYQVSIRHSMKLFMNATVNVPDQRLKCEFWDEYVCFKISEILPLIITDHPEIKICAKNKNVNNLGACDPIRIPMDVYNKAPSAPEISTWIPRGNGIVTLKWTPPIATPTKIKRFYIRVDHVNTIRQTKDINMYPIRMERPALPKINEYSVDLHLDTSTNYTVSIIASNNGGWNSTKCQTNILVPEGIAFAKGEKVEVWQNGALIKVKTPKIINATIDTTVSVVVEGLTKCTRANSRINRREWNVMVYKGKDNASKVLSIGAGYNHGDLSNCSLQMGEPYVVRFVVKDQYSGASVNLSSLPITLTVDKEHEKSNLFYLVILPILAICLVLSVLVIYRKRMERLQSRQTDASTENPKSPWIQLKASTPYSNTTSIRSQDQQSPPDVIPDDENSRTVEIEMFESYTKEIFVDGLLKSQYSMFPRGLQRSHAYGSLPENMAKNRYKDLIAYDDTRVVLEKIPGKPHSDYINANYIQGYRNERAYIATQGPKPNTVNDFWRMIWQENVQVICMLANVVEGGKKKCEKYWPEVGKDGIYDDIIVTNTVQQVFVNYTFRSFVLSCEEEERKITHLHYTGWPDHGVPMYTEYLVPYLRKLLETEIENGPIVVHCSAGVGRTGTIILCDTCLRRTKAEGVIDLPGATSKMRKCRANMVDNVQQYFLAHLVIMEYMHSDRTQIPCNVLQEKIKELKKQLPSEIQRLNDAVWKDRALQSLDASADLIAEDMTNYEIPELIEASPGVAPVESSPIFNSQSRYMVSVGIDGQRMRNQYLTSRLPSPANRSDLWRIIAEEKVELVIILQRPDPDDPTYCDVIPDEPSLVLIPKIEDEAKTSHDDEKTFTIAEFTLTEDKKEAQPLTVITYNGWGCGKNGKPPLASGLVSLWLASEKVSRKETPTFVLCRDGVTGCGLYVALSFLLEQMAVEKICNVVSVVQVVRRFKPEIVKTLKEFEYLYDAALEYEKCFQTYGNFC